MGYFWILPNFDPDEFPFMACSGDSAINLINIKEKTCEPLIICEQTCTWGQQAFFFTEEDKDISLHFTMGSKMDTGNVRLEWVRMPLKSDLIKIIKKLGSPPTSDT